LVATTIFPKEKKIRKHQSHDPALSTQMRRCHILLLKIYISV
jgi:hypothetical protein